MIFCVVYFGYLYKSSRETGFYYVSSRYYDPEVGRFISADTLDILGVSKNLYDKNLYAYCDNNPVIRKDTGGAFWDTALDVISLGASVAAVREDPTPGYKGPKNPYHCNAHFHIDRREKGSSGPFRKVFTGLMEWLRR